MSFTLVNCLNNMLQILINQFLISKRLYLRNLKPTLYEETNCNTISPYYAEL